MSTQMFDLFDLFGVAVLSMIIGILLGWFGKPSSRGSTEVGDPADWWKRGERPPF